MHEVDNWNLLNAKIDMLTKKLEASTKVSNPMTVYSCDYCRGGHSTLECQRGFSSQEPSIEQLNALNNFRGIKETPIQTHIIWVGVTILIFHGQTKEGHPTLTKDLSSHPPVSNTRLHSISNKRTSLI